MAHTQKQLEAYLQGRRQIKKAEKEAHTPHHIRMYNVRILTHTHTHTHKSSWRPTCNCQGQGALEETASTEKKAVVKAKEEAVQLNCFRSAAKLFSECSSSSESTPPPPPNFLINNPNFNPNTNNPITNT
jgi:hypothetical protein